MRPIPIRLVIVFLFTTLRTMAGEPFPYAIPSARKESPAGTAFAAYRDGRLHAAVELARPLAAAGDGDALFLMAFALESQQEPARLSRGQAMDYYYRKAEAAGHPEAGYRVELVRMASSRESERDEALASLEASLKAGDSAAMRILGEAWLRGLANGAPDAAKALGFWTEAADAGDRQALLLLGKLREGKFGFPEVKDLHEAADSYRKAADRGEKDALLMLARLMLDGPAGIRDVPAGREWLGKAIAGGDTSAWEVSGDHQDNAATARESFTKGAGAGDDGCMFKLAAMLLKKNGNDEAGKEWLKKAADAGNPEAAAMLGRRLLVQGQEDTAIPYLLLAANEGLPSAQHELGMAYLEGKGCAADPVAAVAWLTEAMKSGDAGTQYDLGLLHEKGIGCPVNYANAGVLYTLACNKGNAAAAAGIARMTAEGLGTKRSPTQAWAHASLAIERGDSSAKKLLADLEPAMKEADLAEAEKILAGLRASAKQPADTANPEISRGNP